MYYFQRVEERSKQARKALKNCELAQRQKKFGFKEAVISSRGECTGCRNPDDGTLDRKCKRCQYNEYYEAKAISLNQIAKEEIKGTGYEIRVNGQKVVSEKGMPDRFYGEIRILKPVIDRDYMLVSDGMTEKAIRSCMKKILKDIKEEQKKWKLMDR